MKRAWALVLDGLPAFTRLTDAIRYVCGTYTDQIPELLRKFHFSRRRGRGSRTLTG